MAVKYAVDFTLIYVLTGIFWTPIDYMLSLASLSAGKASLFSPALSLTLLLWTLPFIWIGVMLSVRRARDAGLPIWLVVLFFIPGANYVLMLTLALRPSASIVTIESLEAPVPAHANSARALLAGVGAGVLTGVALGASGTVALETYGLSLFAATPFVSGAVSAFVSTRLNPRSGSSTAVVLCTLGALAATFVLVAFEGIVCLAMATPLMIPLAMLGGLLGEALARAGAGRATIALMIAVVPGGQVVDAATASAPLREVLTTIEIAESPETVWRNVVVFSEIDSPPTWYFRLGLSYPLRARIEGTGVGATRYCEFTTGAFVEPITAWEEPTRLAFDVVSQPPPLREWSPYRTIYAPHVRGFFTTSRGEFQLVRLPSGHTRLEGRTWYSLRMQPQGYWTAIADAILHRIHWRVLAHIKSESEISSRVLPRSEETLDAVSKSAAQRQRLSAAEHDIHVSVAGRMQLGDPIDLDDH